MKKLIINPWIAVCLLLWLMPGRSAAQQDFTMYQMPVMQQASYVNPASTPVSKFNLYLIPILPSLNTTVSNSGFAVNDLYRQEGSTLRVGFGTVLEQLKPKNYIVGNVQLDLFAFGMRLGKSYFSLNVTEKVNTRFVYPKDAVQLLWEGNGGSLLGRRADFSGTGLFMTHYREYGLGFAREIFSGFTAGIKLKYLYGMENIHTSSSDFGLTTDAETFFLTVDGSAHIQTAGLSEDAIDDIDDQGPKHYLLGRQNRGGAIDLGVKFNILKKLELSASLVDIGYITWNEHVKNYRQDQFSFTFKGMELDDLIDGDSSAQSAQDALLDSIENTFSPYENSESYTTALPGRFYLGARLDLTKRTNAGMILYGEMVKGHLLPGMSLSLNTRLKQRLYASVNYSIFNRSFVNVGAGLTANLGPIQLFVMSDNIIAAFNITSVRNLHLRFGSNIIFGKKKEEDKL